MLRIRRKIIRAFKNTSTSHCREKEGETGKENDEKIIFGSGHGFSPSDTERKAEEREGWGRLVGRSCGASTVYWSKGQIVLERI